MKHIFNVFVFYLMLVTANAFAVDCPVNAIYNNSTCQCNTGYTAVNHNYIFNNSTKISDANKNNYTMLSNGYEYSVLLSGLVSSGDDVNIKGSVLLSNTDSGTMPVDTTVPGTNIGDKCWCRIVEPFETIWKYVDTASDLGNCATKCIAEMNSSSVSSVFGSNGILMGGSICVSDFCDSWYYYNENLYISGYLSAAFNGPTSVGVGEEHSYAFVGTDPELVETSPEYDGLGVMDWRSFFDFGQFMGHSACLPNTAPKKGEINTTITATGGEHTGEQCWCQGFNFKSTDGTSTSFEGDWVYLGSYKQSDGRSCHDECAVNCGVELYKGGTQTDETYKFKYQFFKHIPMGPGECKPHLINKPLLFYNTNDGINWNLFKTIYYNLYNTFVDLPVLTRENHTFLGWCEESKTCANPIMQLIVTSENFGQKAFYAQWSSDAFVCPDGYEYSDINATSQNQCYKISTCPDLVCPEHSTCSYVGDTTWNEYYGVEDTTTHCSVSVTSCVDGYSLENTECVCADPKVVDDGVCHDVCSGDYEWNGVMCDCPSDKFDYENNYTCHDKCQGDQYWDDVLHQCKLICNNGWIDDGTGITCRETTYNVDFDGRGATSGSMEPMMNLLFLQTYNLPKNNFIKEGYEFLGWCSTVTCQIIEYPDEGKIKGFINIDGMTGTLYAQWGQIVCSSGQYFDSAQNACSGCPDGYEYSDTNATSQNQCYKISTCPNLICPEHSTCSYVDDSPWNTYYGDTEFDGCAIEFECNTGYDKNVNECVLHNYTITYNLDSGTNNPNNPSTYNITTPTITFENPTRSGSVFEGWFTDSTFTTPITEIPTGSTGNVTVYAKWSINEFAVTTTSDTTSFSFQMSAAGDFTVSCGDGGILSGTGVSGNTITRSDTTERTYTCNWENAAVHTINFSGDATGYSANYAAIRFNLKGNNTDTNSVKIASISGSLGQIFGTVENPVVGIGQPNFYHTFDNSTNLTGNISGNLFKGIYGAPTSNMFSMTFNGCSGLTGTIPSNLFADISGAPAHSMFDSTFAYCPGLTGSIPANLFAGISGAPASRMFYQTFEGDTGLTGSIPANLFAGISGAPAHSMFAYTFYSCRGLSGNIPSNLFAGISGAPADHMFVNTFGFCSRLTGSIPADLFKGISGAPARNMFQYTFYGCSGLSGSIPGSLFAGISGAPAERMFQYTFYGCSNLTSYIPPTLFAGISKTTTAASQMNNIFTNTGLLTSCPSGTTKYTTGFESWFGGKVSCKGKTSMSVAGHSMALSETQETHPALAIKIDDKTYYAKMSVQTAESDLPVVPGATEKIHIKMNGTVYNVHE